MPSKNTDYGHRIVGTISFLERRRRRFMNEGLGAYGLHGTMYMYITTLSNYPASSQDFLSEHLCIDKSNVARAAKKLEANGYIIREISPMDRRQYRMFLTEKGKELLPVIQDLMSKWSDIACEGIDDLYKKRAADVVTQMLENVSSKA